MSDVETLKKLFWGKKLIFGEPCERPLPEYGIMSGTSVRVYLLPSGTVVADARIRRVLVLSGAGLLMFPLMRSVVGKPSWKNEWKTYKCTKVVPFSSGMSDHRGQRFLLHYNVTYLSFSKSVALLTKDINKGKQFAEIIDKSGVAPYFRFWVNEDRARWDRYRSACINVDGIIYALKKDEGRYKYARIATSAVLEEILNRCAADPEYRPFVELVRSCDAGADADGHDSPVVAPFQPVSGA